jgi:uncharacterized protein (TIGR02271 family)
MSQAIRSEKNEKEGPPMGKIVVGLFEDFTEAQSVVQDLVNAGLSRHDISLAASQAVSGYTEDAWNSANTDEVVGQDAGVGAGVGGVIGLLVGLGALAIPGIGPVLAAGPLAAALGITVGSTVTGAAIGGVAGGLVGVLTHLGVPPKHAEYYAEGVRRGGTLVTVNSPDDRAEEAVDILNGHGAVDIEQRASTYKTAGYTGYTEAAPAYTNEDITRERDLYRTTPTTATNTVGATGEQVIPVVEETLAVGKRQVQGGGARIHTFVTDRPVEESVSLHEEHVTVDRRPVDRAVTNADTAFKEGTFEVTETSEVPMVSKEARVVEEVVGKTATDRTETVRDTVRRTDVDVEKLDTMRGSDINNLDEDDTLDANRTMVGARGAIGTAERDLPGNRVPGVQIGGRDADGSPDTRGISEEVADAVTGDHTEDKIGAPTR